MGLLDYIRKIFRRKKKEILSKYVIHIKNLEGKTLPDKEKNKALNLLDKLPLFCYTPEEGNVLALEMVVSKEYRIVGPILDPIALVQKPSTKYVIITYANGGLKIIPCNKKEKKEIGQYHFWLCGNGYRGDVKILKEKKENLTL